MTTTDNDAANRRISSPHDAEYAEAVRTLTGSCRPDSAVRAASIDDVVAAIREARAGRMPLTVRSGGHSMAGLSSASEGMLLDIRGLDAIDVDSETRTVHVGGGACWGRVSRALAPYGLALTSGDTNGVGVGGLTLGGGVGWLVRRFGLAIDSLIGAQVVTGQGRVLEVSEISHSDLFWALRGGGANLGVVTRFDFRTHPIPEVLFGTITLAARDPKAVMIGWRDAMREADDAVTTALTCVPGSGQGPPSMTVQACVAGTDGTAWAEVHRLHELGEVLESDVRPCPYPDILEDADMPEGFRIAVSSAFLPELDSATLEAADALRRSPTMISLRSLGGACGRVPSGATAFSHRGAEALLIAFEPGADPNGRPEGWSALEQLSSGPYVNFSSHPADSSVAYPSETSVMLNQIREKYDLTADFSSSRQ